VIQEQLKIAAKSLVAATEENPKPVTCFAGCVWRLRETAPEPEMRPTQDLTAAERRAINPTD